MSLVKKKKKIRKARKIRAEQFDGNIEYKLRLCDFTNTSRIDNLTTQLYYRLYEGDGKAIYNIGYSDNGNPRGIPMDTLCKNLSLFHTILTTSNCRLLSVNILRGIEGYCANIYLESLKGNIFDDVLSECY